jgi:LysM repeat protein
MQVIGTEAQGDDAMLRELSQQVRIAEASSGVSGLSVAPRFTSGIESSQAAPLASREGLFVAPSSASNQQVDPEAKAAVDQTAPEAQVAGSTTTTGLEEQAPACTPDPGGAPYCVYTVQEGDTLSDIAERLGLESTAAFSAAELVALSNGLNDAQNWLIQIDQELRVPVASGVIHTVSESETVSAVAELYGVPTADVVAANGLADGDTVVVGATLLIPSPNLWPLSSPGSAATTEEDLDGEVEEAAGDEATTPEETTQGEEATTDDEAGESTPEGEAGPEEGAETPTAEPSPEQTQGPSSPHANPSVGEIRDQFAAGYIAGGGPAQYLEKILASVIPCESGYNLRAYNPGGPFYGLMQFLPETWARTGGGDWFDAWQQGHNTGVLLQRSSPSTQWPSCWR